MSLPVIWVNDSGVSVSSNSLTKTASGPTWGNAGASSVQMFAGDVIASFTVSETDKSRMFGFSYTDPDTSYTSMIFAIYAANDGKLRVLENGSVRKSWNNYYL
jgi:hypothetical protein